MLSRPVTRVSPRPYYRSHCYTLELVVDIVDAAREQSPIGKLLCSSVNRKGLSRARLTVREDGAVESGEEPVAYRLPDMSKDILLCAILPEDLVEAKSMLVRIVTSLAARQCYAIARGMHAPYGLPCAASACV